MKREYDYMIVGGGLCGLVLAKELSKKGKKILVLEKGGFVNILGSAFFDPFFYDKWALSTSRQGVTIYRFFAVGGTSIVSCGNAVELTDEEYRRIGINFKGEMEEAGRESCVKREGVPVGKASAKIMEVANKLGYNMRPMPKFSITGKCPSCGECVLGCGYKSKWTSRECLKCTNMENVKLVTGFSADKIIESGGKAIGVEGTGRHFKRQKFFAEKVVLAAGGIGTPMILQKSGIKAGDNLFVDLFNVTYGISKEYNQRKEMVMSVVCDKFHKSEGFALSPFVDCFAGFIPCAESRHMLHTFKINRMMGIMTKIADDNIGKVYADGSIDKAPTENDLRKLKRGSDIAKEILIGCDIEPKNIFVGKIRGAHPGGTAAIGSVVEVNLETKLKNLYVCDASVLPFAPGLPPMLSLIALTKWFGKNVLGK